MINWLNLRDEGVSYVSTWARNRIAWEFKKRRGGDLDAPEDRQQFHDAAIEAAFLESAAKYRVRRWDGPLTLCRPPLSARWEVAPGRLVGKDKHYLFAENGWKRFAPELRVHEVPGDHDSMVLEPNVRVLAARMKAVLDQAQTARSWAPARAMTYEAAE